MYAKRRRAYTDFGYRGSLTRVHDLRPAERRRPGAFVCSSQQTVMRRVWDNDRAVEYAF